MKMQVPEFSSQDLQNLWSIIENYTHSYNAHEHRTMALVLPPIYKISHLLSYTSILNKKVTCLKFGFLNLELSEMVSVQGYHMITTMI